MALGERHSFIKSLSAPRLVPHLGGVEIQSTAVGDTLPTILKDSRNNLKT